MDVSIVILTLVFLAMFLVPFLTISIMQKVKEHKKLQENPLKYFIRNIDENKTVGIIICKRENKYVIEFCSDDRIIAREYELV